MIHAKFLCKNNVFRSFEVRGHSEYSEQGTDIVCAGVSACVEMVINGITEVLNEQCKLNVNKDIAFISLTLEQSSVIGPKFIEALYHQLKILSETYPQNINVTYK